MTAGCPKCGKAVSETARFCKRCGSAVTPRLAPAPRSSPPSPPAANHAARVLPPRDLRQSSDRPIGTAISALPQGAKVAVGGAVIALVGCFLPLASGVGENISVIPSLVNEVPHALVVPLSAVAIAVMAWIAQTARADRRSLLHGGVIAVASPWVTFLLLGLLASNRASSYLGPFAFGAGIGVGVIVLALGFSASLVGGFLSLLDTARALDAAGRSGVQ